MFFARWGHLWMGCEEWPNTRTHWNRIFWVRYDHSIETLRTIWGLFLLLQMDTGDTKAYEAMPTNDLRVLGSLSLPRTWRCQQQRQQQQQEQLYQEQRPGSKCFHALRFAIYVFATYCDNHFMCPSSAKLLQAHEKVLLGALAKVKLWLRSDRINGCN